MKKQIFLTLTIFCLLTPGKAENIFPLVDTLSIESPSMNTSIKNVIILPNDYNKSNTRYPVVYLLHGYSGNYATWIKQTKPTLQQEASKLNIIIVCPDGKNSWYWDSPKKKSSRFDTYVSKELTAYIDSIYRTKANKENRAITGFSMGGHGGLWLGINHPNIFGACGSMSGGVDIRPFPDHWEMKTSLGKYEENKELWNTHTVINQIHKIKPNSMAIIIDCGINDFFYPVNQELHKQLIYHNIPHDFISRPGAHTQEYWNNAVDFQLLFFYKFFYQ